MTRWIRDLAPGVRALTGRIDVAAFSPDGGLVAFWCTRGASADLVVRERVYVVEIATGRELVALDGPEIVRAIAFASDELLLVQRDVTGGAWLRLHAIPDGGVVAETMFATGGAMETELQVSGDRRAVYAAPVWRSGTRKVSDGAVYSLPDLELRLAVSPYQLVESAARGDLGVAGRSALDAEGRRVAVYYHGALRRGHVVIHSGRGASAVFEVPIDTYNASIRWLARDRLLLGSRVGLQDFVSVALSAADPSSGGARAGEWAESVAFEAFDESLDPDGARIVGVTPARGAPMPTAEGLAVLDARNGAALAPLPAERTPRQARAVGWTADGAHVLWVGGAAEVSVTALSLDGATRAETRLPVGSLRTDAGLRVWGLPGGAVALTASDRANAVQAYFIGR